MGGVRLEIADLARSIDYYTHVLGLRELDRAAGEIALGAEGGARSLVTLVERPGARPAPRRGRLGLYHFAMLRSDRASLGRFVRHLAEVGARAGAADHLVSEAFYLQDPDNLGIEVYADRPRDTWRRAGRQLMMATDPVGQFARFDDSSIVRIVGEIADVRGQSLDTGSTPAVAVLLAAAVAAVLIPARHAARIDPIRALREESHLPAFPIRRRTSAPQSDAIR